MAAVAKYLVDNSALSRVNLPEVERVLQPLIEAGLVATCAMIDFEVLWSTRSPKQFNAVRANRSLGYEWLATEDTDWRRALDVQGRLWAAGKMRSVPLPDLLISAVAERHHVTVIHYDSDFDLIAAVTHQKTQWVVPRGSIAAPAAPASL